MRVFFPPGAMDPAYGDDLWAAGISSDEEEEIQPGPGSHDLDLLASLVEKREVEGGGGGEGGDTGKRLNTIDSREKTATFEESLTTPNEVSLMKAKMQAMEKELQKLRQQISSTSNTERPRPKCQAATRESRQAPRIPAPSSASSVAMTASSSLSKPTRGTPAKPAPPVHDRRIADELVAQREADRENNVTTDVFSGIRIKNPLVSSELMKNRMKGRKMIKIPNISSRVKGSDIEGDWVTVGVVVDKLPPKESVKGNKYAVWKLSDLSSQSAVVTLFLFGKAYQEHWKMVQGSVVALLNPTIMPNRETGTVDTSSSQLALSLDLAQKLMPLGVSQDFTVCRAHTKAGRKCTNFAKASDGGFCDYHIQGAYKKMRTGRMECQGGYGPSTSNLRGKLFKDSKTDVFYYGGQSYTSGSGGRGGRGVGKNSDAGGEQDSRLFAPGVRASMEEVSQEMRGRRAERASDVAGKRVTTSEGDLFKQMLGGQTPGARLINSHLQKEEAKKQQATKPPEKSASELLREEREVTKQPDKETSQTQPSKPVTSEHGRKSKPVLRAADSQGRSVTDSCKRRRSSDINGPERHPPPVMSPPHLPHQEQCGEPRNKRQKETSDSKSSVSPFQPRLGRGLAPGSVLDFAGGRSSAPSSQNKKAAVNKLKAAAILRRSQSEIGTSDILHRVEENRVADVSPYITPADGVTRREEGEEEGPLSKRRKLDPAEVEMILNAKSSHEWAAREVEWEREEQYFSLREKKENMEQRLISIKELHVYVSQCKLCNYVAEEAGDLCRQRGHPLTRLKAVKRWFECQECHERCCAYNTRYPPFACRKCGSKSFKQTSLFRERKGPKVGAENLLLRGREEKFLN